MPKVVAPLFSVVATGLLGGSIDYVCGLYARSTPSQTEVPPSADQSLRRSKFLAGVAVWQGLGVQKLLWNDFYQWLATDPNCNANLFGIVNGYNAFMSLYLKLGPGGWPEYPLPPAAHPD